VCVGYVPCVVEIIGNLSTQYHASLQAQGRVQSNMLSNFWHRYNNIVMWGWQTQRRIRLIPLSFLLLPKKRRHVLNLATHTDDTVIKQDNACSLTPDLRDGWILQVATWTFSKEHNITKFLLQAAEGFQEMFRVTIFWITRGAKTEHNKIVICNIYCVKCKERFQ
jgi:hypothetical protein